ncbi:MAG: hypothetical protein ACOYM3_02395 [Terrimicrobiaceae bacterium]
MKKIFYLLLLTMAGPAFAALDIVAAHAENDQPLYVLKNTSTGKVLGTFWDRAKEKSDYGFESSIVPDFFWSKDRDYVAVSGGASRSRTISLYKVAGNSLREITVPQLDEQQAAPINVITDPVADGLDAIRWQPDGTLLVRFWAAERVTSDSEQQKEANVWADLAVNGRTAKIIGTSSEEPAGSSPESLPPNPAPPAGETLASRDARPAKNQESPTYAQACSGEQPPDESESFDPNRLVGVHNVSGKNPDGTAYKGTVEIRVVNGVVGLEWKIGSSVSHGSGILVGQTLGVALDDGIAIYHLIGQSEGQSLIGFWSGAGSTATNPEAILIGNADMTQANLPAEQINGKYTSLREVDDGQVEGSVKISGGEIAKTALWKIGNKSSKCQGLALSDGLAVLTPSGLSVFTKRGDSLEGQAVTLKGKICQESLIPAN